MMRHCHRGRAMLEYSCNDGWRWVEGMTVDQLGGVAMMAKRVDWQAGKLVANND